MNYLKKETLKYEYKSSFFLAVIVVISFILGKYLSLKNPLFYVPIFIFWLIMVVVLQYLSQQAEKRRLNYLKGYKGEKFIEEILKKLPNNYRYIKSIKLKYGNLDFLVINQNGVYGIENKNINGKIIKDEKNGKLLRNYMPFQKDYINQVKGGCLEISQIIKSKLNINLFVSPILVFSGLGVSIETPPKVGGVDVLSSETIVDFFINKKDNILDQANQENIYNLFYNLNKYKQ